MNNSLTCFCVKATVTLKTNKKQANNDIQETNDLNDSGIDSLCIVG